MEYYTVYFEIYGKKMKVTVEANNLKEAKSIVSGKINFHKVEKVKTTNEDEVFNFLKNTFGIR